MTFPSSVHVLYLICVLTILPISVKNVYVKNELTGDWEYLSESQEGSGDDHIYDDEDLHSEGSGSGEIFE